MKDELPLALIPEEAECAPGAEECDGEDDSEGFEYPLWVYKFDSSVWLCGRVARRGLRARGGVAFGWSWHESSV